MVKVLCIGGSDAGISAALRIREVAPEDQVTVMLRDAYPNFSICGLPMYLSGEVKAWRNLAHRTAADIENAGIKVMINTTAKSIDADGHIVHAVNEKGEEIEVGYDKLIIGTGAVSRKPRMAGLDLPGVHFLRWMGDVMTVKKALVEDAPKSAIVIGGGYIGLELADAFIKLGLETTLVEYHQAVMKTVDVELGREVGKVLESHGVKVHTNVAVSKIQRAESGKLAVIGSNNLNVEAEIVLVCTGATPSTELAETAGCIVGKKFKALQVDEYMRTNVADIYAAGDCVETKHCLMNDPTYIALGTISHKQGRIAGQNAVLGDERKFMGSLGTQVIRIFDNAISRTGLNMEEANALGYKPYCNDFETWDHKVYYPGAHRIRIRVVADLKTEKILGAQIFGHFQGEVAKRIDIFANAIFHGMTIESFNDLDLSYTPPLSAPWDPTQMAAQAWAKDVRQKNLK